MARYLWILGFVACSGADKASDADNTESGTTEPPPPVLTEDEFVDQFIDGFCLAWEDCTGTECPVTGQQPTTTGTVPCVYDPTAAQACLEGEWGCELDDTYGVMLPVLPEECRGVCGADPSTTTTP
jgi:hypothetical protein